MDETGFKYDITLTKVDTRHNRNERYALTVSPPPHGAALMPTFRSLTKLTHQLQLYESNAEPYTYATNCQFAGTGRLPGNNVIAAIGCTFPTAFRAFKKTFKEKTGVEWNDRIEHALERSKREKRDRGLGTGSDAGSRRGVPVSERGESVQVVEDFANMPFEYHPPRFGARGKLPSEKFEEGGPLHDVPINSAGKDRVEHWMSGANGAGPEVHDDTTTAAEYVGDQGTQEHNDFQSFVNEGINGEANGNHFGGLPIPADQSVFDKDIEEILDGTYPFNPNDYDNFDFTLGDHTTEQNHGQGDNLSTAHEQASLAHNIGDVTQPGTSFDQGMSDLPQHPTSFDLPSTVQDSFQPGTQEVGETQMVERARGELEEFMNLPMDAESETIDKVSAVPSLPTGLDLGSSMLGKRKAAETEESTTEQDSQTKKQKITDVDAAPAAAAAHAEQSFDEDSPYLLASQAVPSTAGEIADEQIPRALLEELQDDEHATHATETEKLPVQLILAIRT